MSDLHYPMIERLARVIERDRKRGYEWTDKQFEIWFNRDPDFVSRATVHSGGFRGTRKEHLIREVRLMLNTLRVANGSMIDRARVILAERDPGINLAPELVWETMIDAILDEGTLDG